MDTENTASDTEATMKTVGFPCAGCGSQMVYDPAGNGLRCPYCEGTSPIPEKKITAPEYVFFPDTETYDAPDWNEEGNRHVSCASCGADVVVSAASVTAKCPFCGSNYVTELPGDQHIICPETMVPFHVTAATAKDTFSRWAKKRFWAPRDFRRGGASRPDVSGIYIPHWTFDADLSTAYRGQGGRDRTVHYTVRVNGKTETRTKTVTDWFPISGNESLSFDDQLCCASKKVDRKLLGRVGPFSLKILNVYNPAYLAGYFAERYDLGLSQGFESVKPIFQSKMIAYIQDRRGYDHYRFMEYEHHYNTVKFKHILLPVYTSVYRYKTKEYPFLVNGETGTAAGKAPVSALKVIIAVLIGLGLIALATIVAYYANI